MKELKGWPFESLDKEISPLGGGNGGDPLPVPG